MATLKKAEDAQPGLGLALLDTYFPGDLRDEDRTFWEAARESTRYKKKKVTPSGTNVT